MGSIRRADWAVQVTMIDDIEMRLCALDEALTGRGDAMLMLAARSTDCSNQALAGRSVRAIAVEISR